MRLAPVLVALEFAQKAIGQDECEIWPKGQIPDGPETIHRAMLANTEQGSRS